VGKSERLAGAVLSDLRSMRQNPRATELRSEVGDRGWCFVFKPQCGLYGVVHFHVIAAAPQSCSRSVVRQGWVVNGSAAAVQWVKSDLTAAVCCCCCCCRRLR
jgi:hypothetical protein